jgi:hypothetical protein
MAVKVIVECRIAPTENYPAVYLKMYDLFNYVLPHCRNSSAIKRNGRTIAFYNSGLEICGLVSMYGSVTLKTPSICETFMTLICMRTYLLNLKFYCIRHDSEFLSSLSERFFTLVLRLKYSHKIATIFENCINSSILVSDIKGGTY